LRRTSHHGTLPAGPGDDKMTEGDRHFALWPQGGLGVFSSSSTEHKQMRIFLAVAIAVSLGGLAHAQNVPQYGETDKEKTQVQKDADRAAERAYERSLGSIPDKGSSDPWGAVRSNDASKPSVAHTPPAKKTKTGSASAKSAPAN
jgi:hypothetical protein